MAGPPFAVRLALGASLASRGAMIKVAAVFALLTALGGVAIALSLARKGSSVALADLPAAMARVLAWGPALLAAIAASSRAFEEDRARGIRALLHARGGSASVYAWTRALGFALLLAALVSGGTLLTGAVAILGSEETGRAFAVLVASLVYGVAYAAIVAPLALAALGGRGRGVGTMGFLALLVVPDQLLRWTSRLLPGRWGNLLSVPSILAELRHSLVPSFDAAGLGRAVFGLAVLGLLVGFVLRSEVARFDAARDEALP
ncbi:MAG TPA: hypothetical protein VGI39_04165 [Polyangiaceae bacterium]